ncbi:MAG TPA: TonB-dependent receptor [Pyrinomonadaceae bacterium]|nr:TonB-dependent receptor [Pyrinomonadaceae bacterium]
MKLLQKRTAQGLVLSLTLLLTLCSLGAQQPELTGSFRGKVTDELGGILIGSNVTIRDKNGVAKTTKTNADGVFTLSGMVPGQYYVRVEAEHFAPYENSALKITAGQVTAIDLKLGVSMEQQEVLITEEPRINTSPENNAGGIVIAGEALERLPDDPDRLTAYLQALAGPGAGPNGAQVIVDGFTGVGVPPKDSIREVRINRNPFSAEYERMGFGRIEITTRAGTDRFRGQVAYTFNDESLNSRNPFASNRAPYQDRLLTGYVSGPLIAKKSAFSVSFQRKATDENAYVSAVILSPALIPVALNLGVLTPQADMTLSPRIDYQLDPNNTLIGRYTFSHSTFRGAGIGGFSLPSRGFNVSSNEHVLQLTETAVVGARVVNEARFQFIHRRGSRQGDDSLPGIVVLDAFAGGGSPVGQGFNSENRIEFSDFVTYAPGNHTLRGGLRARHVRLSDFSHDNFRGEYSFTSLKQYQQVLSHVAGAIPDRFTINGGNPAAGVSQSDLGVFIQDDWKLRPNFTLSLGLRYETQTNLHSALSFSPRVSFAWAPGAGGKQPKSVLRGGFGIFYERVPEGLTLQANRFNGLNQQQFLVTDPTVLSQFPIPPTVETLAGFALPQNKKIVAPDIRSPYSMQSALSLEQQLPFDFTMSATLINSRTVHSLRSRNINAPLPGNGVRPLPNEGNIFAYESNGFANQNQLIISVTHFSRAFALFASYGLNKATSDTDGVSSFPLSSYDLRSERGPSSLDIRHFLFLGGSVSLPWKVRLNANLVVRSGVPYNITTGEDTNGDGSYTERPSIAVDLTRSGLVVTPLGVFDPHPRPGDQVISRNYGRGPIFVLPDLQFERVFRFNHLPLFSSNGKSAAASQAGKGKKAERYGLTVSVQISNFLNHVNFDQPIGNLKSPFFGTSNATAGGFGFGGARVDFGGNPPTSDRRIILRARFNF